MSRNTGYKYGLTKPCLGGDKCKHTKCECGHCMSYHLWKYECQQLDRATLQTCPCKKFAHKNPKPIKENVNE